MHHTPVYIICSPRPLVGKTLIARLLSEFLLLKQGTVTAFDINLKEPSLLDYLPNVTETADISDTYGKMSLIDRVIVDDGLAKVIDLGFHAFDEFFKMSDEIGFLKEAARRRVARHPAGILRLRPSGRGSGAHPNVLRLLPEKLRATASGNSASRRERRGTRPPPLRAAVLSTRPGDARRNRCCRAVRCASAGRFRHLRRPKYPAALQRSPHMHARHWRKP